MSMQMVVPETQDEILAFRQWFCKKRLEIEQDQRRLEDEKQRWESQREKL